MNHAPIALFVYNRLWHTQQTIDALAKNEGADQSELYIFSDGPKSEKENDKVNALRQYLKTITGFKTVSIIESEKNKGLASSIIAGVTHVVEKHGTIIVMEDDLVTSPYFLSYLNQGLALYKNEEQVISIHGYVYPVKEKLPETFFIKGADCWGWATWKRGWDIFEADGKKLFAEIKEKKLSREFDYNNSFQFMRMLRFQSKGLVDSWAIRWYASAFLKDKLTLYPSISYLRNIGFDSTGTNTTTVDKKRFVSAVNNNKPQVVKIKIEEETDAKRMLCKYLKDSSPSLLIKIISRIKIVIKRF